MTRRPTRDRTRQRFGVLTACIAIVAMAWLADGADGYGGPRGLAQAGSFARPEVTPGSVSWAFAADGSGRLYFGDTAGGIAVTDLNGQGAAAWTIADASRAGAYSMASGPPGEIAIARPSLNRVEIYTWDGTLIRVLRGALLDGASAATYLPSGDLRVRTGSSVVNVGSNGNLSRIVFGFAGLGVAGSGRYTWLGSEEGLVGYSGHRMSTLLGSGSPVRHRYGDYHAVTGVSASPGGGVWSLDGSLHYTTPEGQMRLECSVDQSTGNALSVGRVGTTLVVPAGRTVFRFAESASATPICVRPKLAIAGVRLQRKTGATRPSQLRVRLTRPASFSMELFVVRRRACNQSDEHARCEHLASVTYSRARPVHAHASVPLTDLPRWRRLPLGARYALRVSATSHGERADYPLMRFSLPAARSTAATARSRG